MKNIKKLFNLFTEKIIQTNFNNQFFITFKLIIIKTNIHMLKKLIQKIIFQYIHIVICRNKNKCTK